MRLRSKLLKKLIVLNQILLFFIFRTFALLFVQQKNVSPFSPKDNENIRYVLVATHRAAVDPFVITTNLKFNNFFMLSPFSFFTMNRFYDNLLLRPFLILFGCFPAQSHKHGYGIKKAQTLLEEDHTIFIFPEGRVGRLDREHQPKKGVEVLAQLPDVLLIPARVRWNRHKGLWKSYSLAIGEPFSGKNMTAEQIMDVVYSLKFR